MTEYYSPGQLSVIYQFLKQPPKWLLLGGPADANEAQTALAKWPDIKVIAVEANINAVSWQLANAWPTNNALLLHAALSDMSGEAKMIQGVGCLRGASLDPIKFAGQEENLVTVKTVTLDQLDEMYGPFEEAVLWIDIEGWELEAVKGASKLLQRNAIRLVNAEGMDRSQAKNEELERNLIGHGFKAVKDWNDSPSCRDRIYVRGYDA